MSLASYNCNGWVFTVLLENTINFIWYDFMAIVGLSSFCSKIIIAGYVFVCLCRKRKEFVVFWRHRREKVLTDQLMICVDRTRTSMGRHHWQHDHAHSKYISQNKGKIYCCSIQLTERLSSIYSIPSYIKRGHMGFKKVTLLPQNTLRWSVDFNERLHPPPCKILITYFVTTPWNIQQKLCMWSVPDVARY